MALRDASPHAKRTLEPPLSPVETLDLSLLPPSLRDEIDDDIVSIWFGECAG